MHYLLACKIHTAFPKAISAIVYNHDIPGDLIIDLDQISLSYMSPDKYTLDKRAAKNVPKKAADDKRKVATTFAFSVIGTFLSLQLN